MSCVEIGIGEGGTRSRSVASAAVDTVDILGVRVSAVDLQSSVDCIERWIAARQPNYVCVGGAHGVIESRNNARLREIHNAAGLVVPDGMPLVLMANRLGYPRVQRVYGPDLMRRLTEISALKGYRQFYYGGGPGLAERLAQTLHRRFPGLIVAGTLAPPFRPLTPAEDLVMSEEIAAAKPDIVWVGLSTPKQEFWMASHVGRVDAPVLIGVGAAFDFLAGTKRQAPKWMQRVALEWLFRLVSEPRRLWRRYAVVVPSFAVLGVLQIVRHKLSLGRQLRR